MHSEEVKQLLARRVKELREQRGWTQQDLAQKLHVARATVASWEIGKNEPSGEMLLKIAQVFDVSIDYLLGFTDDSTSPSKQLPGAIDLRPIPVYNGANAGRTGGFPDAFQILQWIMIPVKRPGKFGVIIHGDSMEPDICDGDIVVVDPDMEIHNGDMALVIIEDEAFVKRLYRQDGAVVLHSSNPKYPPFVIPERKLKMYLVGKVVGLHRLY